MLNDKKVLTFIILNLLIFNVILFGYVSKKPVIQLPKIEIPVEPIKPEPVVPEPLVNYTIKNPIPAYLDYNEMMLQLKEWVKEAPKLTEAGTYGKTAGKRDLVYFLIHNPKKEKRPAILITAAIHGNESWSSGVTMGYIGTILDQYGDDDEVTEIVNTADLYFIPIISPDTYPDRREINGVDPNRNFPTLQNPERKSIQQIQALVEFFLNVKPCAVISGHTFGRMYLQPYGDSFKDPPNQNDYQRIIGKMAEMSQYTLEKACRVYRQLIYGSEVDWYYRHGAFSIVTEYGTHQKPPSQSEIISEFNRTFRATIHFLKEAPKVKVEFLVRKAA